MQSARSVRRLAWPVVVVTLLAACGDDDDTGSPAATAAPPPVTEIVVDPVTTIPSTPVELFPDVVAATAEPSGDTWTFAATLSSPYDTPERYADAWRVVGPDGTVYGIRELTHDHQNEQPFTRTLSGVAIPAGVDTVTVEGRDQLSGWGGATVDVDLDSP